MMKWTIGIVRHLYATTNTVKNASFMHIRVSLQTRKQQSTKINVIKTTIIKMDNTLQYNLLCYIRMDIEALTIRTSSALHSLIRL